MTRPKVLVPLAGITLGLALAFLVLRLIPRSSSPPPVSQRIDGELLSEDQGALAEVLLHYVPELEAFVAETYRDFLHALPVDTTLVIVVPRVESPRKSAVDAFRDFLAGIDRSLVSRTRFVEVPGPISVWSKDRALVASSRTARTALLVPTPPDPRWIERSNDWRTLRFVAQAFPDRYYVRELPLAFDAGDFAVTAGRILVDPNLLARNASKLDSTEALARVLRELFTASVDVVGEAEGDVPRHHMSMYMTPLGTTDGTPVALVGDARRGRAVVGGEYVPGEVNPDTGEPLRADFSEATVARFDRAAEALGRLGFRVVRVPTIPFDDKTYVAYTNGVYEVRDGKRTAWVPSYGIARLDDEARGVYEVLGWNVSPVRVKRVYAFHGTIGCLVNVLRRR